MRLPPRGARRQGLGKVGTHVEPAVARPAAEPLDGAADREVDPEGGEVEGDDACRLVTVEDDVRAGVMCSANDGLDVLDLSCPEEDMAGRHEQRPLVDRVDDLGVVLADDDLEVGLGLV